MADIFVSYASEDHDRIEPLVERLASEGWSVWWDRELVAGPSFDEKIEEALDAAKCVVVVWSESAIASRWCRAEATEGLERGILVPARIDDVRPPLAFRASQTASLEGWPRHHAESEMNMLISGIRDLLGATAIVDPVTESRAPTISPVATSKARPLFIGLSLIAVMIGAVIWWYARPDGAPPISDERSLALLEFKFVSDDDDLAWLADAIRRDLSRRLAGLPRFHVPALSATDMVIRSSSSLKNAADELNVDLLLEGTLQRINREDVELTITVMKPDGHVQWTHSAHGALNDVRAFQAAVTGQVFNVLGVESSDFLHSEASQIPAAAYSAYLRAEHYRQTAATSNADQAINRALALAPDWSAAQVARFRIDHQMAEFGDQDARARYTAEAERLSALGFEIDVRYFGDVARYQWDVLENLDRAERYLRESVRKGQTEAYYMYFLACSGLVSEARNYTEFRVVEWAHGAYSWYSLASFRLLDGDVAGALEAAVTASKLSPSSSYVSQLVVIATLAGDLEQARAAAEAVPIRELRERAKFRLAMANGDRDAARQAMQHSMASGEGPLVHLMMSIELGDDASPEHPVSDVNPAIALAAFPKWVREHELVRQSIEQAGFTPEWRLELCRRVATLPEGTGFACDPSRYTLIN